MERYRVTVEYVNRNGLNQNTTLYRQVAARHTETFDLEVKSVYGVSQATLKALREKHPNAAMTGFTCERINANTLPVEPTPEETPRQMIIRTTIEKLSKTDRYAIQGMVTFKSIPASVGCPPDGFRTHWKTAEKLRGLKLAEWVDARRTNHVQLTGLGREVAAALGMGGAE